MITCSFTIHITNKGGYLQWHRSTGEASQIESALAGAIRDNARKAWAEMCANHPATTEMIQAHDVSDEMAEALRKRVTG